MKYFLEIEVIHSQRKYITDLLKETRKLACKPEGTSVDPNHELEEVEKDTMVDRKMYQHLVGRLIYLFHTRLDIAYVVNMISQFMHSLKEIHLQATNRVLQFRKESLGNDILFK